MEKMERLKNYFEEKLEKFGDSFKAVDWGSKSAQEIRFQALSEIDDFSDLTILDIGCGLGHFYNFLKNKNIYLKKYIGIDISDKMVGLAKEKFKTADNVEFYVKNVFDDFSFDFQPDYSFFIGTFNAKVGFNDAEWQLNCMNVIKNMFKISKKGIVINFITTYVDYKEEHLYYANPLLYFDFAKSLSKKVVLRHDYLPFDFMVYVYKE